MMHDRHFTQAQKDTLALASNQKLDKRAVKGLKKLLSQEDFSHDSIRGNATAASSMLNWLRNVVALQKGVPEEELFPEWKKPEEEAVDHHGKHHRLETAAFANRVAHRRGDSPRERSRSGSRQGSRRGSRAGTPDSEKAVNNQPTRIDIQHEKDKVWEIINNLE